MSDKTTYFVDGFLNLSFTAGAFRFELAQFGDNVPVAEQKGASKATLESNAKIIMTPQAFVKATKGMQAFLQEVEDKGIISINQPEGGVDIKPEGKH